LDTWTRYLYIEVPIIRGNVDLKILYFLTLNHLKKFLTLPCDTLNTLNDS